MTVDRSAEQLARAIGAAKRSAAAISRVDRVALRSLVAVAEQVAASLERGGRVYLFGNGGSASDAQHIAAEFVGRYVRERPGLAAIALNTDTSALTAIGNDYGYDQVFARQVEALVRPGDIAIGLSTSGNSPNVIAALERADQLGAVTVAFTGGRRSRCTEIATFTVAATAIETARVQECHILFGHILCELLDADPSDPVEREHSIHAGVSAGLVAERAVWRECGFRVVLTNGVFDLFHHGHLTSLDAAAALGDVLVVALNSDSSVARLKGPERPVVNAGERAKIVSALRCVDRVVIFDDDDPSAIVSTLQPDVWCKGGDYAARDPESLPEVRALATYGGEYVFLPMVDGRSTTQTIASIAESHTTA